MGAEPLRLIIERALENHECVLCKIYQLKERGEIKRLPRCATHYDQSLLIELSVGGYGCKTASSTCGRAKPNRQTVGMTHEQRTRRKLTHLRGKQLVGRLGAKGVYS